jgi:urea carboxylase-associated protein 2
MHSGWFQVWHTSCIDRAMSTHADTRTEFVASDRLLFEEFLQPGATWLHVLKRGTTLRLTDLQGGANAAAIFLNAEFPAERYNMPDTLKAQHIARLTAGCVLYSDMGRVLCSITKDTAGWHDPLSGCLNAAQVAKKYGDARYQEHRNDYHKNPYDSFVIELAKYGLGARDMPAPVNFFSKVTVDEGGDMHFFERHSEAGTFVDLRAEMNVLTIVNSSQHPLDPLPKYAPRPLLLTVFKTPPPAPDDLCRKSRPENERGFILTERYFL